jgi:hypothetical protein
MLRSIAATSRAPVAAAPRAPHGLSRAAVVVRAAAAPAKATAKKTAVTKTVKVGSPPAPRETPTSPSVAALVVGGAAALACLGAVFSRDQGAAAAGQAVLRAIQRGRRSRPAAGCASFKPSQRNAGRVASVSFYGV